MQCDFGNDHGHHQKDGFGGAASPNAHVDTSVAVHQQRPAHRATYRCAVSDPETQRNHPPPGLLWLPPITHATWLLLSPSGYCLHNVSVITRGVEWSPCGTTTRAERKTVVVHYAVGQRHSLPSRDRVFPPRLVNCSGVAKDAGFFMQPTCLPLVFCIPLPCVQVH